jgi:hypothetical protein
MMKSIVLLSLATLQLSAAFRSPVSSGIVRAPRLFSTALSTETFEMSGKKNKEPEKEGIERLMQMLEDADKDPKKKGPPIYEPGSFITHILASLAYVIPIVDSLDLGKYMFEAYPSVGSAFGTIYGPFAAVYNGVPFLPFAIFFLMSYVCRAPTFPVEIRFHFAQAFMISIVQFVPSLLFGLMEKAGVPGMAVLYNTGKTDRQRLSPLCSSYHSNSEIVRRAFPNNITIYQ